MARYTVISAFKYSFNSSATYSAIQQYSDQPGREDLKYANVFRAASADIKCFRARSRINKVSGVDLRFHHKTHKEKEVR